MYKQIELITLASALWEVTYLNLCLSKAVQAAACRQHSTCTTATTHLQQDSTVSIDIRPWVLDLANAAKYIRHNSVEIRYQLEEWIIWQPLESKLTLTYIAWVSHTKHSMTISWNHLSAQ